VSGERNNQAAAKILAAAWLFYQLISFNYLEINLIICFSVPTSTESK